MREAEIAKLVESVKDEIDTLHGIVSLKRRLAAARELIEYLELHHVADAEYALDALEAKARR